MLYVGVGRLGHPFRGGWSHSPPVGKGGDVDDSVLCVGGGYGGRFCFSLISCDEFGLVGGGEWCFSVLGGGRLVQVGGRSGHGSGGLLLLRRRRVLSGKLW